MGHRSDSFSKLDTHSKSRNGAVLIAVLACMLVTFALIGGAMKSTMAARRQCKTELHYQQATLLLQAGVNLIESSTAAELPESWNAISAFPNYTCASVEYQLVESVNPNSAELKCTAKLAISNRPDDLIQLSRIISYSRTSP